MKRKALIIGISGQDGAYLAKLLLQKGYEVHGTSRDAELSNFSSLKLLGLFGQVALHSMSLIDFRSVMQTILEIKPDEIYNLAGQTSVGLSFVQPVETLESISIGTLNILEVIRFHKLDVRFYNASSSECFGETSTEGADERTPFVPRSPYAVAKSAAFWQVANYREAYNLFACSGLLFNHESPLRPLRFVTKKIIRTACEIKKGTKEKLHLGSIEIFRDWGYAPDYVDAIYRILQLNHPEDFVIATGESISLHQFAETAFQHLGLGFDRYVEVDENLIRPSEIKYSKGNPSKAYTKLHWKAETSVHTMIGLMVDDEMNSINCHGTSDGAGKA